MPVARSPGRSCSGTETETIDTALYLNRLINIVQVNVQPKLAVPAMFQPKVNLPATREQLRDTLFNNSRVKLPSSSVTPLYVNNSLELPNLRPTSRNLQE